MLSTLLKSGKTKRFGVSLSSSDALDAVERAEAYKKDVRETVYEFIVFALASRLAGIDGPINDKEVAAFKEIFPIRLSNDKYVKTRLIEAFDDRLSVEHYINRLGIFYPANQHMFKRMITSLFLLAKADGAINKAELYLLKKMNAALQLPESFFLETLKQEILPQTSNPYLVLNVGKFVSEEELKRVYYSEARAYHPDQFSSDAWAHDIAVICSARIKALNHAYDTIKKYKKIR